MNDILLTTKLQMPPLRSDLVVRPRLLARLDSMAAVKLVIVAAPAGFGKTTLVRAWAESCSLPVAWLSLDEQDNNPPQWLRYFIHALRQIHPTLGHAALELLTSPHHPQIATVLTLLINDLSTFSGPLAIIFDDYHYLDNLAIHQAMDFLLAHLPDHVHLIITSRHQPPLALSRWRAQHRLLELTSADLRFTAGEVETFLQAVMHLNIAPADRIALEMRTEGWIAGLQLAALSLQNQADKGAFIRTFSGLDRDINDYLLEEVLHHQPAEVRHFLLATAVVDRLCGSLADALLEQSGSQTMLEQLDRRQLFIVPLDRHRHWYRYHALFADLLRHHARRTMPQQLPGLHRRASLWFEQHNSPADAIQHALQAEDAQRAADLIEAALQRRNWLQHDMHRLLTWLDALPEAVTQTRPRLKLGAAWLLLEIFSDPWPRIEPYLRQVEAVLTAPNAHHHFTTPALHAMLAEVDLLRANRARQNGDAADVIALCRQALARLPHSETYLRSGIIAHLASAYENLGDMAQADALYTDSLALCQSANNIDGRLFAAARLMAVLTVRGRLQRADQIATPLLAELAERTGPDIGLLYIHLADIYREQNRLDAAKRLLQQGLDLCRPFEAWREGVITGLMTLAGIAAAEGQFDAALAHLDEVDTTPPSPRLAMFRARLHLAEGDFKAAAQWARPHNRFPAVAVDYPHERDALTYVWLLLTQAALDAQGLRVERLAVDPLAEASTMLTHLHQAASAGDRTGHIIEIHLLQSLLATLRRQPAQATDHVAQALQLAEPEGYVRLFVAFGEPIYTHLKLLRARPVIATATDYLNTLLAAFPQAESAPVDYLPGSTLTERERVTLRWLASELTIEAIAAEMAVSVSTIRTYAKRIYSKLDAHSRAEAVYRAKELHLL
ncbi:MAG: hypothetical protein KDJ52_28270 [Anaerolineae bacterium]|nr:hypothetical protein [Anaerolineae bacterium]